MRKNITPEGKGCILAFFKILTTFLLMVIGLVMLLAILFQCSDSPTTKTNFNESLISDMEKQFGITVMDNIELVKASDVIFIATKPNNVIDVLNEIKTDDYESFLKRNTNYEVENFEVTNSQIENSFTARFHYNIKRNHEDYNVVGRIFRYSDNGDYHIYLCYTW